MLTKESEKVFLGVFILKRYIPSISALKYFTMQY